MNEEIFDKASGPEFVVFTGVDERTDPGWIREMGARWPIEWGVLVSKDRSGSNARFPKLDMGRRLSDGRVRLAAHLCGTWARQVFAGEADLDPTMIEAVEGFYGRIQINVGDDEGLIAAGAAEASSGGNGDPGVSVAALVAASAARLGAARAIVQCRSPVFPDTEEVDWLFDMSGGFGVAPSEWPDASWRDAAWHGGPARVGYAGGLGPKTVKDAVALFDAAHVRSPFWIDMETKIRTDDILDLDKCESVCRSIWGDGVAKA